MKPRRVSSIHFETEAGESSTATPRACTSRVYLACLCKSMVMIVTSTVPCIIRGRRSVSSKYHGHETSLCKSAGPQQQHEYWQQSQSLNKMAFSTTHKHSSKAFKNQSDCQFAVSACTVLRKACIQQLLHVRHIFAYSCMFLHIVACGSSPLAHLQHHRSWTPPGCHAWPHGHLQLLPAHKPLWRCSLTQFHPLQSPQCPTLQVA